MADANPVLLTTVHVQAALKAPVNTVTAKEAAAEAAVPNQGSAWEAAAAAQASKHQNAVEPALFPAVGHQLIGARGPLHGLKLNLSRLSRSLGMGNMGQDSRLPSFDRLNASHKSGTLMRDTVVLNVQNLVCVLLLAGLFWLAHVSARMCATKSAKEV